MISYTFSPVQMAPLVKTPLFCDLIKAGFPSPADDYSDCSLDFNEYLIKNRAATFIVRVQGDSMIEAGIDTGDLLVVDRSIRPEPGRIVIAVVDGEFTVKRLHRDLGQWSLMPENPDYPVINITGEMDFQVWGVVTHAIHSFA